MSSGWPASKDFPGRTHTRRDKLINFVGEVSVAMRRGSTGLQAWIMEAMGIEGQNGGSFR